VKGEPLEKAASNAPIALHERAEENLSFIRDAMFRSSSFTAVPGWGMVAMGVIALAGSWVAASQSSHDWWVATWTLVAVAACSVGIGAMLLKARRNRASLFTGPGRRFVLSFSPSIAAGCILSELFYRQNLDHFMAPTWLMLYGIAVMNGGAYSIKPVPLTGLCFLVLGVAAAFLPLEDVSIANGFLLRDAVLAVGFGGLHVALGLIIARHYGG
jgi:hypothetical protein